MRIVFACGALLLLIGSADAACLPDMSEVSIRGTVTTVRGDKNDKQIYYFLRTPVGYCVNDPDDGPSNLKPSNLLSMPGTTIQTLGPLLGKQVIVDAQITGTRGSGPC